MNDRDRIQYVAGSLAASAFIAVTQILTGVKLDLPLYVALALFAINIPFQIFIFLVGRPIPTNSEDAQRIAATPQPLSRPLWLWSGIHLLSTPAIVIGFVAMFWHFAWWLGILFALSAWIAYRIFRDTAM
jgi:hypothetical protein